MRLPIKYTKFLLVAILVEGTKADELPLEIPVEGVLQLQNELLDNNLVKDKNYISTDFPVTRLGRVAILTSTATLTPSSTPTNTPTATPTSSPTPTDTPTVTSTPSPTPTDTPTEEPTEEPTEKPTEEPTDEEPTEEPTEEPAPTPSYTPTPTRVLLGLLEPPQDAQIEVRQIHFKWEWMGDPLAGDEHFALRVWRPEDYPRQKSITWVEAPEYILTLDDPPVDIEFSPGYYYWNIGVVRELCPDHQKRECWEALYESEPRRLYIKTEALRPTPLPPPPTPTPTPTPTQWRPP